MTTLIDQLLLYFCVAVCVIYLISGGYRAARDFWRNQIDKRAAEKIIATQSSVQKDNLP